MKKLIEVLWPSFLVAGLAEIVFFTVVNPQELYLFGEPVHFSATATYSIDRLAADLGAVLMVLGRVVAAEHRIRLGGQCGADKMQRRRLMSQLRQRRNSE